jgi:hypothetical protein
MMGIGGLIALIPVRRPVVVTEKDSVPEDALTA